jgi:glycosyltransferase involved in cell wall biosynthesis
MQKISAIIITFNEESKIIRCLQSIQDIADEIVVVDSFSTDKTREICEQYKVRFSEHVFKGYIDQKNWALDQTTYNVVLSLDADEVLSDTLRANIAKAKETWDADGYMFSRTTFIGNKPIRHGSWYPDYKLRLFDKQKGRFGGTNPHDGVIMNAAAKIKRMEGTILHYSFDLLTDFYRQSEHLAFLAAQAMYEKKRKINPVTHMAKTGWAFCKSYFLKAGFLDGKDGFIISRVIAATTYSKYNQLRKLYRNASSV